MTTAIEWTDTTWNPTTGCDRVSPGCDHCYALTMAKRLKGMGAAKYQRDGNPRTSGPGFGITEHPDVLGEPLRWRKPRRVFVNSMSDLFHQRVSDEFLARVWAVMAATPQHTYQVLTKRHARMRALLNDHRWKVWAWAAQAELTGSCMPRDAWPLPNVWLGVSVEDQKRADLRIPALLDTPAAVRFLSCEPLLGPVDLGSIAWGDPDYPDWIIVGGESGPGARPMHPDWPRFLRDQCLSSSDGRPAFFFKQWGAHIPKDHSRGIYGGIRDVTVDGDWTPHERDRRDGAVPMVPFVKRHHGRELDGRTWDEFPTTEPRIGDGPTFPADVVTQ